VTVSLPNGGIAAPPAIRVQSVAKDYGAGAQRTAVLADMSLTVEPGEFVCLVGASGCGKSTLLQLIAGLDRASAGVVEVNGPPPALLFQDGALFPWLTVAENVEFPLRMQHAGKQARRRRVAELLELVHLRGADKKRPHQLSGGMQQRVAIARSYSLDPQVLLMDEPFGALDALTRDLLHEEVERIWRECNLTVVFVTHDVHEAVRLGDRVLLLAGKPGYIAAEYAVDLARPRSAESVEVHGLAAAITRRLREEAGKHVAA
jgi:NitT/TauT family transport system ATP-binding protein